MPNTTKDQISTQKKDCDMQRKEDRLEVTKVSKRVSELDRKVNILQENVLDSDFSLKKVVVQNSKDIASLLKVITPLAAKAERESKFAWNGVMPIVRTIIGAVVLYYIMLHIKTP